MANKMTCLDYCQYLLATQINYTLTNFADYSSKFGHDKINRFLRDEKITPRRIWDNVVWVRLKYLAIASYSNVYQLKHGLLQDYLVQKMIKLMPWH